MSIKLLVLKISFSNVNIPFLNEALGITKMKMELLFIKIHKNNLCMNYIQWWKWMKKKWMKLKRKMYHSSKMHSCILQYHCVCKCGVILYIPFWSPQRRIQFLRFRCCCLRHGEGDFWVLSEYRKAQQIMSLFYTSKLSSIFIVLSFIQGTLLRSELILCTDLIWVYSNAK